MLPLTAVLSFQVLRILCAVCAARTAYSVHGVCCVIAVRVICTVIRYDLLKSGLIVPHILHILHLLCLMPLPPLLRLLKLLHKSVALFGVLTGHSVHLPYAPFRLYKTLFGHCSTPLFRILEALEFVPDILQSYGFAGLSCSAYSIFSRSFSMPLSRIAINML